MRNKEIPYEYQTHAEQQAGRKHRAEVYETRKQILPHGHKDREQSLIPYRNAMQKQLDAMTEACASDMAKESNADLEQIVFAVINDLLGEAQDCNNHHMDSHTLFVLRQASAIKEYLNRAPLDIPPQA